MVMEPGKGVGECILLSKINCMSKINQTSSQNFSAPIVRERCQADIVMLIVSSSLNLTRDKLN